MMRCVQFLLLPFPLLFASCGIFDRSNEPEPRHRPAPPEDWPVQPTTDEAPSEQAGQILAQGPQDDDPVPSALRGIEGAEDTVLSVGTFSLGWAFDEVDDRTTRANEHNAASKKDWAWKVEAVGKVLVEQKLDIVALQSVGGRRELIDLMHYVLSNGGPNYDLAYVKGTDGISAQQVAVLSKHLVHDARRLDVAVSKHVVVDIMLPNYEQITVVALQLRAGKYRSQVQFRLAETRRIKRQVKRLRRLGPVLIIGDLGSHLLPENEGYGASSPGLLANVDTRSKADDCVDSGNWYEAQRTTTTGEARDRMIFCDLVPDPDTFAVIGQDRMVVGAVDPAHTPWSAIPLKDRDVSDHYLLRASIPFKRAQPGTPEN
ncbi:MAG: hypothetical protein V3V08_15680 [Nannocystaceae bacterium]